MRCLIALTFLLATVGAARPADWPLFGGNAARTGIGDAPTLSTENVGTLRVRWRVMLGGTADAAPIVVGNRLYLTRGDGTTLAIDTADGRTVWRFATTGPKITSSVPAYDSGTHALYVPGVDGAVHQLDPANGNERRADGFPLRITLARDTEKNASSLNVANGYLYAQTSGYVGDATPYVGHVVAIHLNDATVHVFNSLCSTRHELIEPRSCRAQRSGMWSRAGVVADPEPSMHGRIYAATGNGPYDAGAGNYGDSILSLTADASRLIGSLTPDDAADLDASDRDVGSSSPALLPRQPDSATPLLAVQGGKDSVLRLFDRARMAGPAKPLQTVPLSGELFSAPAVWTNRQGATFIFLGLSDGVHAYAVTTSNRTTRLTPVWHANLMADNEGTSPVVADGVVFVAISGHLVALDAANGRRLWSAALGPIHWQSPALAGGTVYCSDDDGALTAFSLSPQ
jgi:outer membrane protein assembly factor BamB